MKRMWWGLLGVAILATTSGCRHTCGESKCKLFSRDSCDTAPTRLTSATRDNAACSVPLGYPMSSGPVSGPSYPAPGGGIPTPGSGPGPGHDPADVRARGADGRAAVVREEHPAAAAGPVAAGECGRVSEVGRAGCKTNGERPGVSGPCLDSVRHGPLTPGRSLFDNCPYSTVTLFARFRGLSTSQPRSTAIS